MQRLACTTIATLLLLAGGAAARAADEARPAPAPSPVIVEEQAPRTDAGEVTPGEGGEEGDVPWSLDAEAPPPDAQRSYDMDIGVLPSLGDREVGEAATRDGERVEWNRWLPFFAQGAIDQGFDLPNPYGAGGVFYMQSQDAVVSDLKVSFNGGDEIPIDFLQFGTARVENVVGQMKLDAWVLPFLNVYVTGGYVSGDVQVPMQLDGTALIDAILPPLLGCSGPAPPALCGETYEVTIKPEYRGGNVTVGTVAAVGWRQFFALANFAYTWSWIDIVDTTVTAIYFSPRAGITGDMGNLGSVQAYMGAGYLATDVTMTGTIPVDVGAPGLPQIETIGFSIQQKNKDRWNFLVGTNWDVKRWLSLQAELGFAGSRSNVIATATYRW